VSRTYPHHLLPPPDTGGQTRPQQRILALPASTLRVRPPPTASAWHSVSAAVTGTARGRDTAVTPLQARPVSRTNPTTGLRCVSVLDALAGCGGPRSFPRRPGRPCASTRERRQARPGNDPAVAPGTNEPPRRRARWSIRCSGCSRTASA